MIDSTSDERMEGVVDLAHAKMIVSMLQVLVHGPGEAFATLVVAIKLLADASRFSVEETVKEFELVLRSLEASDEQGKPIVEEQTLQ